MAASRRHVRAPLQASVERARRAWTAAAARAAETRAALASAKAVAKEAQAACDRAWADLKLTEMAQRHGGRP
jgi:hypothetical protein